MVLTNAERQKRFRQRLKARAAGADLSQQAKEAVDRGFTAIWDALVRNAETIGGGPDTFADLLAFRQYFAARPAEALEALEGWLDPEWETDLTDDERASIEKAAGVYRAALMKHLPPAPATKRSTRKG